MEQDRKNYAKWFVIIAVLNIVIIIALLVINICSFNDINISQWLRLNISITSIVALLLWLARYFNRRTHECTHIKEEYEHKAIILKSFKAYGDRIKDLSGNNHLPLLAFIERVSITINKSPTRYYRFS